MTDTGYRSRPWPVPAEREPHPAAPPHPSRRPPGRRRKIPSREGRENAASSGDLQSSNGAPLAHRALRRELRRWRRRRRGSEPRSACGALRRCNWSRNDSNWWWRGARFAEVEPVSPTAAAFSAKRATPSTCLLEPQRGVVGMEAAVPSTLPGKDDASVSASPELDRSIPGTTTHSTAPARSSSAGGRGSSWR